MNAYYILAVLLPFLIYVKTGEVKYFPCNDKEIYQGLNCTINRVTIEGCKGATTRECKLKRGEPGKIVFDYTPYFDADNATLTMYSLSFGERKWPGMNEKACEFMKCPIQNGVNNTYTYGVNLSPTYPTGIFQVRFLMMSESQPKCCFISKIKIER